MIEIEVETTKWTGNIIHEKDTANITSQRRILTDGR
jgi:hypothetical protein